MTMPTRSFDAFPATHAGRSFARTWWGRAWVDALRDSSLDESQLRKGRAYARRGQVGAITLGPGFVAATVRDTSLEDFRAVVRVAELSDAQWERLAEQIASSSGHLLALLDSSMPGELLDDAAAVDVALLPELGDLEPECECDAWELPCVHAAALCYQVSWLLDADPFVLMLMRGRDAPQLLGELRTGAAEQSEPAGDDPVRAYACTPEPLPHWEFAPTYERPDDVPPGPGVEPAAIRGLVEGAATRAAALLTMSRKGS